MALTVFIVSWMETLFIRLEKNYTDAKAKGKKLDSIEKMRRD